MLPGLGGYGDDSQSDSDAHPGAAVYRKRKGPSDESVHSWNADRQPEAGPSKSQVIIKRPPILKPSPRAPLAEDDQAPFFAQPEDPVAHSDAPEDSEELPRIRSLLQPPPIPGFPDWGIPPAPSGACNPEIEAKLSQFHHLKRDPVNPKHFNDSLMANRSFRNPHLYTKLVEFVDVDERATNFPKEIWDPEDVKEEWYADKIAEYQRQRSAQQQANASKRTNVAFAPASSKATGLQPGIVDHEPNSGIKKASTQSYGPQQRISGVGREKVSRWR